MTIDAVTRSWIRNAADEAAAKNGCTFDPVRASHACDFFPKYLRLYEGEKAGQQFELMPWQIEILSRLFGWVKDSAFFGRKVRRFRKASIWLPKKSGKSPFAAGVALYLLIADGEQGQKVFSAAKDGKQAGLIHTHGRKMIESSPELRAACKINMSTGRITFVPTSSTYDILSGDNPQGTEGINGSVIVDECHVVDNRLATVIEHAGASRAEPLQLEVSTVGKDPLSYARKQWEHGLAVNAGTRRDESFFFQAYAAPQDATDEQLNDPAVWRAANPSWNFTINEAEFRDAFERSRRSLMDWTSFKQYRLNIWSNSANPFIKVADWAACQEDFDERNLAGQSCIAGLDLSRKQDLTALVLLFGPDENSEFRVLVFCWLPEDRAKELDGEIPYRQWADEGFIKLIPGNVMQFNIVKADILKIAERFKIQSVVFDPLFAEELTQELAETGIERIEFGQRLLNFARPTAEFESLVIGRKLHHNGHPILSWQCGHVMVKEAGGLMRPVRPNRGDPRTIDTVVALVMALGHAIEQEPAEETRSIYDVENRGFTVIG